MGNKFEIIYEAKNYLLFQINDVETLVSINRLENNTIKCFISILHHKDDPMMLSISEMKEELSKLYTDIKDELDLLTSEFILNS